MPVGRPEDLADGRPMRSYRGKPNPLGVATEWTCVGCGQKNTDGRRIEDGCGHCGAGTPGTAGTPPEASPRAASSTGAGDPTPRPQNDRPRRVETVQPAVEPLTKVYRLIEYVARPDALDHLRTVLQRSLVGTIHLGGVQMTASVVDDVSPRQQDILGLIGRQPGVWLGKPTAAVTPSEGRLWDLRNHTPVAVTRDGREISLSPAPHKVVRTQDDRAIPLEDAGDVFDQARKDREMTNLPNPQDHAVAKAIEEMGGLRLCYTLALALQMFAEQANTGMEQEKHYTEGECLRLAQALMDLIPADWAPAPEGEEPPTETLKEA